MEEVAYWDINNGTINSIYNEIDPSYAATSPASKAVAAAAASLVDIRSSNDNSNSIAHLPHLPSIEQHQHQQSLPINISAECDPLVLFYQDVQDGGISPEVVNVSTPPGAIEHDFATSASADSISRNMVDILVGGTDDVRPRRRKKKRLRQVTPPREGDDPANNNNFFSSLESQQPDLNSSPLMEPLGMKTSAAKQPAQSENEELLEEVRESDVLFGRGSRSNLHVGNQMYLRLVKKYSGLHANLPTNKEKHKLCALVQELVKRAGGRFLAKDEITKHWGEVSPYMVRTKITQAFRTSRKLSKKSQASAKIG
eukprot:CAMPEP_0119547344 /NCGR_PEP_ID=MMETSP1352-20130426/1475_1 /TAXON_ID=265584 /ORGANISM="Stauroneis constricta, Strain CCMP1120" /LENGTH=311 /DNA_ID=CAMNT_0007592231 /DNA_START=73 /DNA_END=1005 /DNA_ORIENTATION=-